MIVSKKAVVKAYVAYCLCMDSNVFDRIFGGITDGGTQIGGFQSANPVMLLFSLLLIVSTALLLTPITKRVATVLLNNPFLSGLYLWCLASCLWAEQPSSVIRLMVPLCAYMICGVIAAHYLSSEEAAGLLGDVTSVVAVLSLFWERFDPVRGTIAPGWTGVYGEKNHLGMGMGVGMIALMVLPGRWNLRRYLQFGLCGVLLFGSQSMTAIMFVAATLVVHLLSLLPARAKPLGISFAATAAGLPLLLVPGAVGKAFALSGKSTTFTGRDVIWSFVYQEWLRRPLLGYAYGSYWISEADRVEQNLGWNPGSAHNGLLEMLLNIGVIGALLLTGVLIGGLVLVWRAWRHGERTAAMWLLLAWLAMFIDDLTEADFMVPAPLWFTYCLIFFLAYTALCRRRKMEAAQRPLQGYTASSPVRSPLALPQWQV